MQNIHQKRYPQPPPADPATSGSCSARRQRVSLQVSRCRATTSISEESKLTTSVTWQRRPGWRPRSLWESHWESRRIQDLGESRKLLFRIYSESMGIYVTSHLNLLPAIRPGGRSDIGRELPLPAATVQPGVETRSLASKI